MKEFLIIFLLISALFFGLLPHDIHTDVFTKTIGVRTPPHIILITCSIISFSLAIFISQEDYFKTIYNCSKNVAQSGGRIVKATGKLIHSTASNFDSLDDFADTVETMVEGDSM